jgi:hypothetical protein
LRRLILLTLLLLSVVVPLQSQSGKARRAINKQEKSEKSLEKQYEKSRQVALKHRYKIQSPEVKERMKTSRKKVDQYYKQKNRPVFKDLFTRKKRKR